MHNNAKVRLTYTHQNNAKVAPRFSHGEEFAGPSYIQIEEGGEFYRGEAYPAIGYQLWAFVVEDEGLKAVFSAAMTEEGGVDVDTFARLTDGPVERSLMHELVSEKLVDLETYTDFIAPTAHREIVGRMLSVALKGAQNIDELERLAS